MPPVLNISLDKLVSGKCQQLFPDHFRFRMDQRHHILKLVPETESPSGLIKTASPHETAAYDLILQPSVHQKIDRDIRRFHIHRPQSPLPEPPHIFKFLMRRLDTAKTPHEVPRVIHRSPGAKSKKDLFLLTVLKF